MNVIETALEGVFILEPQVFGDARGWFMESWSQKKKGNTARTALSAESNGTGKTSACLARGNI